MPERKDTSSDFDFDAGDQVRVRVRENGNSGNIKANFEATAKGFRDGALETTDVVFLDPPWDCIGGVQLGPYDATFELLDDADAEPETDACSEEAGA